ncbi:hypothetical protein [Brevibacterium luteolum]|uniref:hypothetical protein n=1 Tax=Brevibacterium luteolum TaxID=199591 RepID=UPI00223BA04B|nr:hypothetical protein [Brevibacterium luteolum]MCT1873530.1 hypothetical protein [Brevibacterium luteolum]MCT1889427.1 hypothetical protein [Brevibacterium luteolum]MCT1893733.1 hypothetical protein [Brevibacterium luteolum]MCT1923170.1 hypothetical protein [Brevibacterium luteolum]
MWILARLVIGSALVSGVVFGAGHVTRLTDTQALPETPTIAVQEAAAGLDETRDTRRAAAAEAGRTAAPEAAYLPTASGAETRPTRRADDDDDTPASGADTPASGADTPASGADAPGAQAEASAESRVRALAADLSRAVANGHASPAAADRFLSEVSGYIRADAHT